MVVCVLTRFFLRPPLSAVAAEHVPIEVEVPVLVFVKVGLHLSASYYLLKIFVQLNKVVYLSLLLY